MDDLSTLERRYVRMQVAHTHLHVLQVIREIFRHLLRQRRHEHALVLLCTNADLRQKIVHLPRQRPHLDDGIEQPRRADDLLDDLLRLFQLIFRRRRRNVDDLIDALLELLEGKRTIVKSGRQTKAVFHKRNLARTVAVEHRLELRHRHMALVHDDEEIVGEVIEQRIRRRPRRSMREVT